MSTAWTLSPFVFWRKYITVASNASVKLYKLASRCTHTHTHTRTMVRVRAHTQKGEGGRNQEVYARAERSSRNSRNQEVHARKDPRAIQEIKKFTRSTQKGERGRGGDGHTQKGEGGWFMVVVVVVALVVVAVPWCDGARSHNSIMC